MILPGELLTSDLGEGPQTATALDTVGSPDDESDVIFRQIEAAIGSNRLVEAQALARHLASRANRPSIISRAWCMASKIAHLRSDEPTALRFAEEARKWATTPVEIAASLACIASATLEIDPEASSDYIDQLEAIKGLPVQVEAQNAVVCGIAAIRAGRIGRRLEALEDMVPRIGELDPIGATSVLALASYVNLCSCRFSRALDLANRAIGILKSESTDLPRAFLHHLRCMAYIGLEDDRRIAHEVKQLVAIAASTDDATLEATAILTRLLWKIARNDSSDPHRPKICDDVRLPAHFRAELLAVHALELALSDAPSARDVAKEARDLSPGIEAQTYGAVAFAVAEHYRPDSPDAGLGAIETCIRECWERGSVFPFVVAARAAPSLLDGIPVSSPDYPLVERALVRAGNALLLERRDPRLFGHDRDSDPIHGLTPRELEVLELVARGHSNGDISRTLCVAESTTKAHMTAILAKTGCDSRLQAALMWRDYAAGRNSTPN